MAYYSILMLKVNAMCNGFVQRLSPLVCTPLPFPDSLLNIYNVGLAL